MIGRVAQGGLRAVVAVPPPLVGLLVAVGAFGCAWALIVPAFQGPDEIQHYSYVESLAQRHALPGASSADPGAGAATPRRVEEIVRAPRRQSANPASSAVVDTLQRINGDGVTAGIARPEQSPVASDRWREQAGRHSQANGGGVFPGSSYPPLYYAMGTVGYWLAPGDTVIDHLYAARLWSILWLLGTTAGVWCLIGELTGGRRELQLVGAAGVGLWPMISFMSSVVNPDAALYTAWTWTFWAMARVLLRGLTVRRLLTLGALTAVAVLIKETSVALAVPFAFVVGLGLWRLRRAGRRVWGPPALAAAGLVALPLLALVGISAVSNRPVLAQATQSLGGLDNAREFASYVWQYYLPRLPGQELHDLYVPVVSAYPAYTVWVASAWGAFGWVTVYFPRGLYPWFLTITIVVALAAIAQVLRLARAGRPERWMTHRGLPLIVAFGLAAVSLLAGLHLTEFKLQSPTNQGRYLFPLAGLAGAALALAALWVPFRWRTQAIAATIGALVVFQLGALGFVAATYYA